MIRLPLAGPYHLLAAIAATPAETPDLRDIAPPVDVFPYPIWMVAAAGLAAAAVIGPLAFLFIRWRRSRPAPPPPTARAIALEQLEAARAQIQTADPYAFSILVSDILRRYISKCYGLPATQQTSPEFLAAAAVNPQFSESIRAALATFLEEVDLIKFARIDATVSDSAALLDRVVEIVRVEPS